MEMDFAAIYNQQGCILVPTFLGASPPVVEATNVFFMTTTARGLILLEATMQEQSFWETLPVIVTEKELETF